MKVPGRRFSRAEVCERRALLGSEKPQRDDSGRRDADVDRTGTGEERLDPDGVMVEQTADCTRPPLALAGPFLIDGAETMDPMATEEASVVAAKSFAGRLLFRNGGIHTRAAEPIKTAQILVEGHGETGDGAADAVSTPENESRNRLIPLLKSMEMGGDGWRGMDVRWIDPSATLAGNLKIDVRDARGANLLNSPAGELSRSSRRSPGGMS